MKFLKGLHRIMIYLGCSVFLLYVLFGMVMGYHFLQESGMNLIVLGLLVILSVYFYIWFYCRIKSLLFDFLFEGKDVQKGDFVEWIPTFAIKKPREKK